MYRRAGLFFLLSLSMPPHSVVANPTNQNTATISENFSQFAIGANQFDELTLTLGKSRWILSHRDAEFTLQTDPELVLTGQCAQFHLFFTKPNAPFNALRLRFKLSADGELIPLALVLSLVQAEFAMAARHRDLQVLLEPDEIRKTINNEYDNGFLAALVEEGRKLAQASCNH